ncbi:MAG: di-heme oxidoredictase family protein [Planctomycetaceae bacterium]
MKRSFPLLRWILPVVVVLPFGYRAAGWLFGSPEPTFQYDAKMSEQGKELFSHVWEPHDRLAPLGDGLGPVFNGKSCVECHNQGGAGGGGSLAFNVTAFTIVPVISKPSFGITDFEQTSHQTPESRAGVVHAFSTSPEHRESLANLSPRLDDVCRPKLADLLPNNSIPNCTIPPSIGVAAGVDVSHRNTPALFGANLIDAIPDRLLIQIEREQRLRWGFSDARTEAVPVGRALRLANGRVGKFGWKAQIGTLPDFVRAACANELGLGNPSQPQPASLNNRSYSPPGIDLTDEQCDQITAFIASLPRPIESVPASENEVAMVAAGKETFHSIGCADCHTPDVGNVKGIYSDLLIHSMGKTLVGGGSYGEPPAELPEFPEGSGPNPSEWRTPPLWGVADCAPYLHDGRAETLEKAIELHGGQAQKSADRFQKLSQSSRMNLIAFLKTLRAPEVEPLPPSDTEEGQQDSLADAVNP